MKIFEGIKGMFTSDSTAKLAGKNINERIFHEDVVVRVNFREYAIQLCINRIANSIAQCEFQTLFRGKNDKGVGWYTLNYQPNKNQNPSEFWNKVINQMIYNPDGALIIRTDDGQLLVAESYNMTKFAMYENFYNNVHVEGFTFQRAFRESEVLHLTHNNSRIRRMIDDVYVDYGKLIAGTIKNYNRSNAMKIAIKIQATFNQLKQMNVDPETGENDFDRTLDNLFEKRLSGLFKDGDSATPIEDGLEIEDLNATGNSKSSGSAANKTTRDITAMFEDIVNIAGNAFDIPRGILKGDVADAGQITKNYINFGVKPWLTNIETEINRKTYSFEQLRNNTKLKIRTSPLRNVDPVEFAPSAEALFRIGAVNVNWVRRELKEEEIEEPWAEKYYVTKNYESILQQNKKEGEELDATEE